MFFFGLSGRKKSKKKDKKEKSKKKKKKAPTLFNWRQMTDIHVKLWTAGGYWTASFHGGFQSMGYPQPSSADWIFHEIFIIQLVRVTETDFAPPSLGSPFFCFSNAISDTL